MSKPGHASKDLTTCEPSTCQFPAMSSVEHKRRLPSAHPRSTPGPCSPIAPRGPGAAHGVHVDAKLAGMDSLDRHAGIVIERGGDC